jgi:hypothetical protein
MPYINWKKLKERVSLRDILDHYGLAEGLTETPHGFEGECPFCESRAFKANTEKVTVQVSLPNNGLAR